MCGLFGMIRDHNAANPHLGALMCLTLGGLAEQRGTDAAGLAMATTGPTTTTDRTALANRRDISVGGWRVAKGRGTFREVWKTHHGLMADLECAPAVLGHTRWATQGAVGLLINSSPLQTGQLIGTHNGDIVAAALNDAFDLPPARGETDTEILLQALDQAEGDVHSTLDVLEATVGRAALAWIDRRHPGTVMLARTAVSPLAVALDDEGNLYWASNPQWFITAARRTGASIQRRNIWLMPEGTLLRINHSTGQPVRERLRTFTATARAKDDRLAPIVAYRGFNTADRIADQALRNHRTLHPPTPRLTRPRQEPLWSSAR